MNQTKLLLLVSSIANAVLLGAVCVHCFSKKLVAGISAAHVYTVAELPNPQPVEAKSSIQMSAPVASFHWHQLMSGDLAQYRDKLRAVGCPELTVRDIIVAEINERFRTRREAIMRSAQTQFWETMLRGEAALRGELAQPLDDLGAERQQLIVAVLGNAGLATSAPPVTPPVDSAPSSDDARLLSSRESLWAADLAGFDPIETEWRAVTQLRVAFEEAQRSLDDSTLDHEEKLRRRESLSAKLESDIRAALGAERYAAYELARDPKFQELHRVARRYGLSDETAKRAFEIQREANLAAEQLVGSSSAQTRAQALTAITLEKDRALKQTLGAAPYATFQEYFGKPE